MQDSLGNTIWDQLTSEPNAGSVSFGGTSAGTANAQTLSAAQFSFIDGQIISFVAGITNTGTMTLSIGGGAPIPVLKNGVSGPVNLAAGDVAAGNSYFVQYSASLAALQLLLSVAPALPTGAFLTGYLYGLTLSNDVGDAVNTLDIATGLASSDGVTPVLMTLSSALVKKSNVIWQVGTNQGGLDTGVIGDGTYHVFLIQRSDTGVVDVLFSLSATSPTLPANYDRKRRIGSIIRSGGTILGFTQSGNRYVLTTGIVDFHATSNFSKALVALTGAPTGISVDALVALQSIAGNTIGGVTDLLVSDGNTPLGATSLAGRCTSESSGTATSIIATNTSTVRTNISRSIYIAAGFSVINGDAVVATSGWIDYQNPRAGG